MSEIPSSPRVELVSMPTACDGGCPGCQATGGLRRYIWGLPTPELAYDPTVFLGGCVVVDNVRPAFRCVSCGTNFDRHGAVAGSMDRLNPVEDTEAVLTTPVTSSASLLALLHLSHEEDLECFFRNLLGRNAYVQVRGGDPEHAWGFDNSDIEIIVSLRRGAQGTCSDWPVTVEELVRTCFTRENIGEEEGLDADPDLPYHPFDLATMPMPELVDAVRVALYRAYH